MRAALAALCAVLAAPAFAADPPKEGEPEHKGPAHIDESKHNFFGVGNRSPIQGMDLCQFCHVPNRLETFGVPPPLWDAKNRNRNAALSERADPAGPPLSLRWAGSTLRCLSCHDSTVSSIAIVYRPASTSLRFDAVASDERRKEGNPRQNYLAMPDEWSGKVMGNHPVAIPYPLDLDPSEYRRYEPRATPLLSNDWNPDPRAKGLKLFADKSGFDVITGTSGVECASCHDPHGTGNEYFLRVRKERSELCLSCHRK
ncbi:MAG: cytochrome c3 family protein [Myxococcales bacterium]